MGTTYGNPYWDKKPEPPKKDPWWENPWFYLWLTVGGIVGIIALGHGVFWQTLFGAFALAVATGKYRLIDMETEFPDNMDEFEFLPKDSK